MRAAWGCVGRSGDGAGEDEAEEAGEQGNGTAEDDDEEEEEQRLLSGLLLADGRPGLAIRGSQT